LRAAVIPLALALGGCRVDLPDPSSLSLGPTTDAAADAAAGVTITRVQSLAMHSDTSGDRLSATFAGAGGAGNTRIVCVGIDSASVTISSVQGDSNGPYTPVGALKTASAPPYPSAMSTQCFFRGNIKAGQETVTLSLSGDTSYRELHLLEYANIDPMSPLGSSSSNVGSSTAIDSGSPIPTPARELILGYLLASACAKCGPELATVTDLGSVTCERIASAAGPYQATGTFDPSCSSGGVPAQWIAWMVTFKP
jgi:hypothetical protein